MTDEQKQQAAREVAKKLCSKYFKNDYGDPFQLTDGQADLFLTIFLRTYPRNQVITGTQYGKSDVISMALTLRSRTFNEPWAIVSGDHGKTQIIMGKVIQHIFDHPYFTSQIEYDPNFPLDRLKRQRTQDHITWKDGGGIRTFTASAQNRSRVTQSLTGYGSPNIVEDEASLIPDDLQAMVLRMLGGHADNFLLKVGNPFNRNHFLKTWQSDKYHKIFINYEQALKEGRYTETFIEEMRHEPFFDVLYECKFPDEDAVLVGGYRRLITTEMLEKSFISQEDFDKLDQTGHKRLGGDHAGGGDRNAYVIRWTDIKVMKLMHSNHDKDTMSQVPIIEDLMDDYDIDEEDVSLDYGGLGQGIGDRLHEKDREVNLIMFGSSAPEKEKYANMRAWMYYQLFKWLEGGGKIVKDDAWYELTAVNYRTDSERKFMIQPKEELKKILKKLNMEVTSPDIADAGVLTFAEADVDDEDDVSFV